VPSAWIVETATTVEVEDDLVADSTVASGGQGTVDVQVVVFSEVQDGLGGGSDLDVLGFGC